MSIAEMHGVANQILKATKPEDIFGVLSAANAQFQQAQAHDIYRRMARIVHPDRWQAAAEADRDLAGRAFAALSGYWEECQHRIDRGVYGKPALGTIKTKTATYELETLVATNDVAEFYSAGKFWVKVAKHPTVNDFLEREVKALHTLRKTPAIARYLPSPLESFLVKSDKTQRRVTVFDAPVGYVPLTDVVVRYPAGVDPRHIIWMWKRLLHVLDFAHATDIIHAAVIPEHVFVHPENHGAMLWEWGFAVAPGQPARALCPARKAWFPPEIATKMALRASTDLFMAAACMSYALGRDPGLTIPGPPRLTRLLSACLIHSPTARTQSGRELYDDVSAAASTLYGPPRYVPLQMA